MSLVGARGTLVGGLNLPVADTEPRRVGKPGSLLGVRREADYRDVVLRDDPVGYWRLGELAGSTAFDLGSGGNNGTHQNTPTLGTAGALTGDADHATSYVGASNEWTQIADDPALDMSGDLTVEAWVRHSGHAGSAGAIAKYDSGADAGWLLYADYTGAGVGGWGGRDGSATFIDTGGGSTLVDDGEWHHLVGTREGSVWTLYVDGEQEAQTDPSTSGDLSNSRALGMAVINDSSKFGWYTGDLDEVAVYDYALIAEQIRRHYYAGLGYRGYPLEVLAAGPVSYWRLGDAPGSSTAVDETGANDGTYNGSPSRTRGVIEGDPDSAATFSGTADKVTLPDIGVGEAAFSVEAWFKRPDNASRAKVIYAEGNSGDADQVLFVYLDPTVTPGGVRFWLNDGTTSTAFTSPAAYDDDQWHHVVCTFDGTTMRIYVDGEERNNTGRTNGYPTFDTSIIGDDSRPSPADNYEWGSEQDGEPDEVAVYDTVLSADEIRRHYQAGLGKRRYELEVLADGPVSYWRLDEKSGSTATDEQGVHDGTHTTPPTLGVDPAITDGGLAASYASGSNEYTTVGDHDDWSPATQGDQSWECWFKTGTTGAAQTFMAKGNATGNLWEWEFKFDALDRATFNLLQADGTGYLGVNYSMTADDQWHHVVAVYDSSTPSLTLYVDGVQQAQDTTTSGTLGPNATSPLTFGRRSDQADQYMDGELDELAIYHTALSAERILAHYLAGVG